MDGYNKNVSFGTDFALNLGGLVSSISQAQLYQAQGQYAEKIGEINARFAEMEAKEVVEAGGREASEHGKTINQMVGKQRAAFAGGNIKVGSGTALAIQQQTLEMGYAEQREIRNNAWRKAFGLKTEAFNQRMAGSAAKIKASQEATGTLIGGAINFSKDSLKSYRDNYGSMTQKSSIEKQVEKELNTKKANDAGTFDPATYGRIA